MNPKTETIERFIKGYYTTIFEAQLDLGYKSTPNQSQARWVLEQFYTWMELDKKAKDIKEKK